MARAAVLLVAVAACSAGAPNHPADDAGPVIDAAVIDAAPPIDAAAIDAAAIDAHVLDAGPPGDPFAALQALPGMCSADAWCWQQPTPHGNDYVQVFATGPDNVWLTAWGTIMQWNGSTWTFHHPPADPPAQFPMQIGGSGPTNMWLIYGNTLQQWDGARWIVRDSSGPSMNDLWVARDTGDAWVTRGNGVLKRWHDADVQLFQPCNCFLGSIWGTSGRDFFITTLPAGILHFDGNGFMSQSTGTQILGGYAGVADDVWVSGGLGGMRHWDGTSWTPIALPAAIDGKWIEPIGYVAHDDVWWFVLQAGGGFLHWDGAAMTFTPAAAPDDSTYPFNSAAIIGGKTWLVGRYGTVYTRTAPTTLSPIINPRFADFAALFGIWGGADDDMYFAVGAELRHWDGAAMSTVALPFAGWSLVTAVGGLRRDGVDELFVGALERDAAGLFTSVALHYDGASWTKAELMQGPTVYSTGRIGHLIAMGPGEALAVGPNGFALHFADDQWTPVATGTTEMLNGVFAPDPDHAWVAGGHGTVLRWDRAAPAVMTRDLSIVTTEDLGPIHGLPGTTWIASATTSSLWRNSGAGWVELPAVTTGTYDGGLWVERLDDILIGNLGSMMSRWNGSQWQPEDNACVVGLFHLFKPPGGTTWAAGTHGIVRHP